MSFSNGIYTKFVYYNQLILEAFLIEIKLNELKRLLHKMSKQKLLKLPTIRFGYNLNNSFYKQMLYYDKLYNQI